MDKSDPPTSHGVFKPVGHVVISFPSADDASAAADALRQAGIGKEQVVRYSDVEMTRQAEIDVERAGGLASLGQELNLVKAQLDLARMGYHFLVVEVDDDEQARHVAELVRPHHAERAQRYGSLVIEELIEHPDDEPQVAESPDRGLDAQTRSGFEEERALRRRR
jgi:hypothetical protein